MQKNFPDLITLAIETSCDDTSVSVMRGRIVLSNVVSSQVDALKFGGIVPELASRAHQANMVPVVEDALVQAGVKLQDIRLIGVTYGPGLIGSLLVGLNFAKGLAYSLDIPYIGVNHIEAHMLAAFLEKPHPDFPFISLIVSGGHTMLVLAEALGRYRILGETQDDAAGECFDKVARFLNIAPENGSGMSGPMVDVRARLGDPEKIKFPRPLGNSDNFHFSFSGLKTSVLNYSKKQEQWSAQEINDMCASFQEAVVDVLISKSLRACMEHRVGSLVLSGGVAANSRLRDMLNQQAQKSDVRLFIPAKSYCTDNAAMIGLTAYLKHLEGEVSPLDLAPNPSLRLIEQRQK
ncbi:tRNA (adenosine(37)-N6)-threonylcarbamoyltransferase complex transferase subunit TsaD [bacterium]|nr:tRNA (adenosine(37)-N6)-threonylcarbamoyltransferase complex transferase subunit TsaD [bacterium]